MASERGRRKPGRQEMRGEKEEAGAIEKHRPVAGVGCVARVAERPELEGKPSNPNPLRA
jgi:hypothetical protein